MCELFCSLITEFLQNKPLWVVASTKLFSYVALHWSTLTNTTHGPRTEHSDEDTFQPPVSVFNLRLNVVILQGNMEPLVAERLKLMAKVFRRECHRVLTSERTTIHGADSMLRVLQLSMAEVNKQVLRSSVRMLQTVAL